VEYESLRVAGDAINESIISYMRKKKGILIGEQTAEKIKKAVPECVVNVYDIDDTAKMTEEIQSSDIFANATIVGMKPLDDQSVVKDLSAFRPGLVVADAVYNPEETKLLREAKEAGCTCVGGKGMLLWQGVAAFKLYTGQDMPVDDVKKLFFS
jgi:shikimate dehydrogenase